MPCFRGIGVSIVTPPESSPLPEFPHPDASSVRILPLGLASQSSRESMSTSPGSGPSLLHKTNPRVSVYVPSVAGSQFWIQYSVSRAPEPPCYFLFKLLMNGRNITNWGLDPGLVSGTITRALYEPGDRWHFRQDGVVFKRSGIESRYFCFAPGPDATAAADDGGLIEVQVFRAKSRRRRTPNLGQYRGQEKYGIMSPSGGLLDHPEEAAYYDWVLDDPTDSPFVSFHFHYRAWSYLVDLNLVSSDNAYSPMRPGQDRSTLPSGLPFLGDGEQEKGTATNNAHSIPKPSEYWADGATVLDTDNPSSDGESLETNANSIFALCSEESLALEVAPRRSLESYAPSIAPSLLPYIEEDSFGNNEEVEYGTATQIPIRSDSLEGLKSGRHRPLPQLPCCKGSGDFAASILRSLASRENDHSSPAQQQHGFHDAQCSRSVGETPMSDLEPPALGTLKLSEGEWMKGDSPIRLHRQGKHA